MHCFTCDCTADNVGAAFAKFLDSFVSAAVGFRMKYCSLIIFKLETTRLDSSIIRTIKRILNRFSKIDKQGLGSAVSFIALKYRGQRASYVASCV